MKVFVDTSALYALVDEDDPRHREAIGSFRTLQDAADLVTHNYVLVEAMALVRRRLAAADEQRLIDVILPVVRTIWVDDEAHRVATAAYRVSGRSGSIVDYVSFEVMRRAGVEVAFAYDSDFDAHGFLPVPTSAPDAAGRRLSEARATYASDSADDTNLVSVAEIAARSGRSTNTIQSWRRRHRDFPAPVAALATGPVWTWPAVAEWIAGRREGRSGAELAEPTLPLSKSGVPDLATHADAYLKGFGDQ